jgi:hypothetical protein
MNLGTWQQNVCKKKQEFFLQRERLLMKNKGDNEYGNKNELREMEL